MGRPQDRLRLLSDLCAVGQLGISLVAPILLGTWLGVLLSDRLALGVVPILVGIGVGVVTAGCTFYRTARAFVARLRRTDEPATSAQPQRQDQEQDRQEGGDPL